MDAARNKKNVKYNEHVVLKLRLGKVPTSSSIKVFLLFYFRGTWSIKVIKPLHRKTKYYSPTLLIDQKTAELFK